MRALFLIPPSELNPRGQPIDRLYGCNYGFDYKPAVHFLHVATYAKAVLGWDVRFLDCPAEGTNRAAFLALACSGEWDVVLHWATYLSAVEDLAAARLIHARRPSTRFVFMGTAPTWKPGEFQIGRHTTCLLGEPEHTLRDLDATWKGDRAIEGTKGLAWFGPRGQLHRGGVRELLDLRTLPMPDRGLLLGQYHANRLGVDPITAMAQSRGCGFRCTFCCTNAMDQAIELEFKRREGSHPAARPPLRKRTPQQVIDEFRDIAAHGYRGVEIADNIFTWGKQRTLQICEGIEDLGLHWICLARPEMLHDPEQLQAMGRAGCKLVYMGSETFDEGLLEDCAKEIRVSDVLKAVQTCRESGVEPEISVLIGASPNETWRTLLHSWRMARSLKTRFVHFSVALPSPSTQMYDQALAQGWFVDGDFRPADNAREVIIDLPHLSHGQLATALKLAYAAQYLSPTGIWKQLRALSSTRDLRHKAGSAARLLGFLAKGGDSDGNAIPPGGPRPRPD